jgi:hypothetical protein
MININFAFNPILLHVIGKSLFKFLLSGKVSVLANPVGHFTFGDLFDLGLHLFPHQLVVSQ